MALIYFLIAFIATTFGALAGLGGGVIIKPVLDTLNDFDLATISVLSSATVFSMAVVSTIRQVRAGFRFEKRMIVLALGAAVGGAVGKQLFSIFIKSVDTNLLKGSQAVILAALLIIILLKDKLPKFNIKNLVFASGLGILLGTIAAFLGIGGGPINVAILCMFLGLATKDAAVISIFIILLSQASKLTLIQIDSGFSAYNLQMLWYMIPAGILGGLIGSKLNRKLSENHINKIFKIMIMLIICINIYNAYVAFSIH